LKKQKKAKVESGKAAKQEHASAKHEDASTSSDSSDDEDDINETTDRDGAVSGAESDHDQKVREQKLFTLKQLIRQLHIHEPVYSVMCLLGKRQVFMLCKLHIFRRQKSERAAGLQAAL